MKSSLNLRRYEDLGSPDMAELIMPSGHQRHVREKAVDELSRLVILFGYLWVVFEWLSVNKGIAPSDILCQRGASVGCFILGNADTT